ncbi:ABC transporter ATP-binding protein [Gordonia neofelifaecis]|uniref:ABC transporter related protein n=1 Tax=Gordonia neofelifaecis NRRL B-59395 TaxID=644548 RepID=F1YPN9_9ACTN|nr:ABC transporter ATP-binding protein [Gordonia neofelifaecis]EGD53318.1 ABC transporter related protein [Gordonia neofelifaecis NRRL B-59395]
MATSAVIELAGLSKRFGRTLVLDGLDLELGAGEVLGFLGPNGAGKSTTIRIVLGLLKRTSGTAKLFGQDPWHRAVSLHSRLAYVPGEVELWPNLTGGQCIDLLSSSGPSLDENRLAQLTERFDFDPSKRVRDASKGNRQKIALIAAFASRAELLILDEPTSGLDPLMEQVFRECVAERAADGTSVLLSSHILSEVDALCERVTIIRRGRVVQSGSVAELRRLSRTSVHAVTETPASPPDDPAITGLHVRSTGAGTELEFSVEPGALDRVLPAILSAGVSALTVRPPSLDELFLDAYEGTR